MPGAGVVLNPVLLGGGIVAVAGDGARIEIGGGVLGQAQRPAGPQSAIKATKLRPSQRSGQLTAPPLDGIQDAPCGKWPLRAPFHPPS